MPKALQRLATRKLVGCGRKFLNAFRKTLRIFFPQLYVRRNASRSLGLFRRNMYSGRSSVNDNCSGRSGAPLNNYATALTSMKFRTIFRIFGR